jgi:6-phosphofructokinase 2
MARVVTITLNPAVDKSISVEQVVPERKLRSDRPVLEPGGGGINVARVLTELGVRAAAHWTLGGYTGARLENLLDDMGIDHHPLVIGGETREHLIVFERATGQQFRFGTPGPVLTGAELEALTDRVAALPAATPYLVLSGSLPEGVPEDTYALLARAAPADCRVVLDTSGPALRHGIETPVFLIKPNVRELGQLAGQEIEDDDQVRGVARRLIEGGAAEVVVTSLGKGGAMATTASEHWHVRAPTVPIRSAVGAGDSMVGGIVAGLTRGRPLREAIRYGVAAGAAAVKTAGTQLCRRDDVEALDARMAAEGQ